jgi:hypothetical protein
MGNERSEQRSNYEQTSHDHLTNVTIAETRSNTHPYCRYYRSITITFLYAERLRFAQQNASCA